LRLEGLNGSSFKQKGHDERAFLADRRADQAASAVFFLKSRGKLRVDDRRVLSGIIYIHKNGLQWKNAPAVYGQAKTLYNRFVRWSRMGCSLGSSLSSPSRDRMAKRS
jgi:hypothetical protein